MTDQFSKNERKNRPQKISKTLGKITKNLNQKNKIKLKVKATKKYQTKANQRKKISYFSSWIDEYVQFSSHPFLLRQMYLVP